MTIREEVDRKKKFRGGIALAGWIIGGCGLGLSVIISEQFHILLLGGFATFLVGLLWGRMIRCTECNGRIGILGGLMKLPETSHQCPFCEVNIDQEVGSGKPESGESQSQAQVPEFSSSPPSGSGSSTFQSNEQTGIQETMSSAPAVIPELTSGSGAGNKFVTRDSGASITSAPVKSPDFTSGSGAGNSFITRDSGASITPGSAQTPEVTTESGGGSGFVTRDSGATISAGSSETPIFEHDDPSIDQPPESPETASLDYAHTSSKLDVPSSPPATPPASVPDSGDNSVTPPTNTDVSPPAEPPQPTQDYDLNEPPSAFLD